MKIFLNIIKGIALFLLSGFILGLMGQVIGDYIYVLLFGEPSGWYPLGYIGGVWGLFLGIITALIVTILTIIKKVCLTINIKFNYCF